MPDGICIARAIHNEGGQPRLEVCEFRRCDAVVNQARVLASLVEEYHLADTPCTSLVQPGEYSLLLIEAPDVEASELRSAVRWRIKDMIDFHIDDAIIDVFDIPGQQDRGRPPMMYVVAARESAVRSRVELLQQSGLDVSIIEVPELAQRNIAAMLPEDIAGVALLYLSQQGGLITLTRQSVLYLSRMIDVGYDALAQFSGTGTEELPPAVQAALDTIILEVQRSLDYYESHFSQPPIKTLVIATTDNVSEAVTTYLNSQLGITVRLLDLSVLLDTGVKMDGELQLHGLTSIGAALREEQAA